MYTNIRDVLALPDVLNGNIWFRPVAWRGKGWALEITGAYIHMVPRLVGKNNNWHPTVSELTIDFETVSPDAVIAERK